MGKLLIARWYQNPGVFGVEFSFRERVPEASEEASKDPILKEWTSRKGCKHRTST